MTGKGPKPALTLVVCTHNPRRDYLEATLASIARQQTLSGGRTTEFILVDNASATPLSESIDLSSIHSARVIREERLGLTFARLRSFYEARGDLILYVDDDNILDPAYVRNVVAAFDFDPLLGAAGGKSLPCYEVPPPDWFGTLNITLACRDLGNTPLTAEWSDSGRQTYPDCAPIGAGMAIRRSSYASYISLAKSSPERVALGRRGADLASGEDNDIVLTLLAEGWRVAYLPQLSLTHLIPAKRLTPAYLARYLESSNRTWVQVLDIHGIRPWPPIPAWSLHLRRAKAYVENRAWRSQANYIRWRGACGLYAGQAQLTASSCNARVKVEV